MKFSPTVPLALVLAAGMAVAAAAQTTPSTSDSKSTVSEPKSTVVKPMTGSTPIQPGLNDKATSPGQLKSSETKAIEPKAKSADMKATQPRTKRTAHLKATHPKRMAQMKATHTKGIRTAHLQRPITQTQNLSPDQVKQAQQKLQAAGLYNGPTDGMMDPDTRAALARFQQQNGLRSTQSLDQQTLARLNAKQTTTGSGASAPTGNQAPPASAGGNTTGQQPINR
jgi:hypothetical protein